MSERRAHQCHAKGCDSEAEFATKMHVNCVSPGLAEIVHMECTVKVCDRHKDKVRPYLLSPRNRAIICTSLMENGHAEPDFLSARIEFVPLKSQPKPVEFIALGTA